MAFLAPRGAEPPDLPPGVVERWEALDADVDVLRFRRAVYRRAGKLWQAMSAIERHTVAGTGPTIDGLAEIWAWICTIAVVVGSPEDTTCAAYAARVNSLLTWCRTNGRDHAAMDVPDFEAWIRSLCLDQRNALNSRITKMAAVRNFYNWRFIHRLGDDRSQYVALPKSLRKLPVRYSEETLTRMFASVEKSRTLEQRVRDKAVLLLLLSAGLRRAELCNLNLHDLDLRKNAGTVRIHGKGAKERDVPLEGPIVPVLSEWLGVREGLPFPVDRDAVFVVLRSAYKGRRMEKGALELLVAKHAKNAGLKNRQFGTHRFRTTYATGLYDEGADVEEIRVLLGHEDINTTLRYIAISDRARKTRLSPQRQHRALGKPAGGQPRWMAAALGGLRNG